MKISEARTLTVNTVVANKLNHFKVVGINKENDKAVSFELEPMHPQLNCNPQTKTIKIDSMKRYDIIELPQEEPQDQQEEVQPVDNLVKVEELERIYKLAWKKIAKVHNGYQDLSFVWDVVDGYKTLDKYDEFVKYYLVDSLSDWDGDFTMYDGIEYESVVIDGESYIKPVDQQDPVEEPQDHQEPVQTTLDTIKVVRLTDSKNGTFKKGKIYEAIKWGNHNYKIKIDDTWKPSPKTNWTEFEPGQRMKKIDDDLYIYKDIKITRDHSGYHCSILTKTHPLPIRVDAPTQKGLINCINRVIEEYGYYKKYKFYGFSPGS